MEFDKKTLTATLTVFLIAIAAFATTIPSTQAQSTSYCFLSANPNPVGVNQTVVVSAWINPIPGGFGGSGYTGLHITIKAENGTQIYAWNPARSDLLGATYFDYKFTETGNYTINFVFDGSGSTPGSTVPEPTILVVQEAQIPEYPPNIPTGDYWTRPIPSTNREWAGIAGNWLLEGYKPHNFGFDSASGYNPYTQAPRAPHIMWTKELTTGGLIGGELGDLGYYPGLSYQPKLKPPLIINGRLYYNIYPDQQMGTVAGTGFVCVDLRTGEEIYRNTAATITMGQTYFYASGNQMGAYSAFLYSTSGSTWTIYDAFDGKQLATLTGATSGMIDFGPSGEILEYYVSGNQFRRWNSTVAFAAAGWISGGFGSEGSYYMPSGSASWSSGVDLTTTASGSAGSSIGVSNGVAVFGSVSSTVRITGFDIHTGQQLYTTQTYTLTASTNNWACGEGAFAANDPAKRTWLFWNTTTGQFIGESEPMAYPWGSYSQHLPVMAYGKMYVGNYAGELNAFDLKTGQIAWTGLSNEAGLESPYGRYPFWYGPIVGGQVVFAATGEHSPTQPLIRGEGLYAFDSETGDRLWFMEGWYVLGAIADGYLISYNAIDNRIYCIGKGPSATEVSISTNPIKAGESTLIQGKVTDQCTALEGTPAISDANMGDWMEYKVMQQPMPTNAIGVPVHIIITHPNGTQEVLDYAIGDMGGSFAKIWTPPGEGLYQVTAYFEGTDSYGSSYATTYIGVSAAAEAGTTEFPQYGTNAWPAYPETLQYTTVDLALMAAVIVAIVIGVVNILMLRKRK